MAQALVVEKMVDMYLPDYYHVIYLIDIRLANNFFVKDVYSLVNGHLFCLVNMLLTAVYCLEKQ